MPPWTSAAGGLPVSIDMLPRVADELLKASGNERVWLLYGEMGSGKTTLVKAVGRALGVTETMSSPTFSIVNEYDGVPGKLYHFDLYRLTSEKEIFDIGTEEYFSSGGWCLVEWPEKLGTLTPPSHFDVRIRPHDNDHRIIEYQLA